MKNAREIAFDLLLKVYKKGSYSNLALKSTITKEGLDSNAAAFLSKLVLGVIERELTLDYNISLYLREPIKKLKPEILCTLRLGAYQIFFMDSVPVSAAVNESVKIIKKTKYKFAQGLVNAVLRKISYNGLKLPDSENAAENLSVRYSCPVWLVELWLKSYGEENTISILEHSVKVPKTYARVNSQRIAKDELIKLLKLEGINAKENKIASNAICFESGGDIAASQAFKDGYFHFQDLSSQILCQEIEAGKGELIFDLCAAPGGKTFTLAQEVGKEGLVKAFDINEKRLKLIKNNLERLKLENVRIQVGDAGVFDESLGRANLVLCDVPCSGFGVIASKPEIKYKKKELIDKLPKLQYFILCNACGYVKDGGLLVYSTCTLNPRENEDVCRKFIDKYKDEFEVLPYKENEDFRNIFPSQFKSDGFFYAVFKKRGRAN
ncbi:MAG: 16S rRNA (cytosine(967)-C(5))-methyltransferase RsmB [Clostridiales bacterium]|nr:16S rRNA (cytosine(967)-C(5))-methyltransferase RsmB [Clostridiales bacterium]